MDTKKLWIILAVFFLVSPASAEDWWNYDWSYRVPITITSQSEEFENPYVRVKVDFEDLLRQLRAEGEISRDSIRLFSNSVEQPIDVEEDLSISWIARGKVGKTPQQFVLYFDLEENGAKETGRRITRNTSWFSGYEKGLSIESPEWKESWAKLATVSWRWCTDSINDKAYLFYGPKFQFVRGRNSNLTTLETNSIRAKFESPVGSGAFCTEEEEKYGVAIDFIQFFPVTDFEMNASLYSSVGQPEFFVPSPSSLPQQGGLSIITYAAETGVEMGWTKDYELVVRNDGDKTLTNAYIALSGIPSTWYRVLTSPSNIAPGYEKKFTVRISPPMISRSRSYPLKLQAFSRESVDTKDVNLKVFTLQSELLRYEIEKVRSKTDQVDAEADRQDLAGMNMTIAKSRIEDARLALGQASTLLDNQMYAQVSEYSDRAEEVALEAEKAISFAQPKQKSFLESAFPLLIILAILAFMATFLIFFRRTNKAYKSVKSFERTISVSEIKKEIQGKDSSLDDLKDERERVERFLMGIGNQHRQGLLSEEAYEELKENSRNKLKAIDEMLGGRR